MKKFLIELLYASFWTKIGVLFALLLLCLLSAFPLISIIAGYNKKLAIIPSFLTIIYFFTFTIIEFEKGVFCVLKSASWLYLFACFVLLLWHAIVKILEFIID